MTAMPGLTSKGHLDEIQAPNHIVWGRMIKGKKGKKVNIHNTGIL